MSDEKQLPGLWIVTGPSGMRRLAGWAVANQPNPPPTMPDANLYIPASAVRELVEQWRARKGCDETHCRSDYSYDCQCRCGDDLEEALQRFEGGK